MFTPPGPPSAPPMPAVLAPSLNGGSGRWTSPRRAVFSSPPSRLSRVHTVFGGVLAARMRLMACLCERSEWPGLLWWCFGCGDQWQGGHGHDIRDPGRPTCGIF